MIYPFVTTPTGPAETPEGWNCQFQQHIIFADNSHTYLHDVGKRATRARV